MVRNKHANDNEELEDDYSRRRRWGCTTGKGRRLHPFHYSSLKNFPFKLREWSERLRGDKGLAWRSGVKNWRRSPSRNWFLPVNVRFIRALIQQVILMLPPPLGLFGPKNLRNSQENQYVSTLPAITYAFLFSGQKLIQSDFILCGLWGEGPGWAYYLPQFIMKKKEKPYIFQQRESMARESLVVISVTQKSLFLLLVPSSSSFYVKWIQKKTKEGEAGFW